MGIHNSLFKFYLELYCSLLRDIANRHSDYIDCSGFDQDMKVILDRCRQEGISFLTKTLPSLGKALDKALATDTQFSHPAFACRFVSGTNKFRTNIPLFMGSLFELVFSPDGMPRYGFENHEDLGPSDYAGATPEAILAVKSLRQVCYLLYKLKLPSTNEQERNVLDSFGRTDSNLLPAFEAGQGRSDVQAITQIARGLILRATCSFDPYAINPRHGPGVVATGEKPWNKMLFKRYYSKIDEVYPYSDYFFYSASHLVDELSSLEQLEDTPLGVAKVVLVPKDSRGPRLISCEPLEFQWMQQGLARALVKHIESHPLTRGHVNFTSQEVNRELALLGSSSGQYVTLDMKEASDRVSCKLVESLFGNPLLKCLMALRTDATRMPDGRIVHLNKFAPMGSALCFPVEALCFWALIVAIIHREHNEGSIFDAAREVFVYGDDIIVRREVYASVLQYLPEFALMANEDKCCTEGLFRESCGCDAYAGVDVTPLKVRTVWSSNRASVLSSYTSYQAWCVENGYDTVATYIENEVEARFERLPLSASRDVGFLHWYAPDRDAYKYNRKYFRTRFNRFLHTYEIYGLGVRAAHKVCGAHNWCSLLEFHSRQPDDYGLEGELPGTYAVPHRSYLKRGWSKLA